MSNFKIVTVFKGSCSYCGIFQEIKHSRCDMPGCLTLHYYDNLICKSCGKELK